MLTFICPTTAKVVQTSIKTSAETLKKLSGFKISVWCPHCQTGHKIMAQDTRTEFTTRLAV